MQKVLLQDLLGGEPILEVVAVVFTALLIDLMHFLRRSVLGVMRRGAPPEGDTDAQRVGVIPTLLYAVKLDT